MTPDSPSPPTEPTRLPGSGSPWWFQAVIGTIGLAMAVIYAVRAFTGETTGRDLIIAAVWFALAAVWFLSSWVAHRRKNPPADR